MGPANLTARLFVSVLTIIELQEQISDLQKRAGSDTNGERAKCYSTLNTNVQIQRDVN